MKAEELQKKTKEEVMCFIRQRLSFDEGVLSSMRGLEPEQVKKQHKRFEMSGYESIKGQCIIWNNSLLNECANV